MNEPTPTFGDYETLLGNDELQFRPIDRALGELMARMAPGIAPEIPLAAALLSRDRGRGVPSLRVPVLRLQGWQG